MRQGAISRGEDIQALPRQYAALINEALSTKPADMTVAIHLCRGNFRSRHFAAGGYEPVAEVLLKELQVDNYLLEFDDERSGGFEPLRFLPKDGKKRVTLGLISTKTGQLEDKAKVVERIREAAKYAPLEQLGVGPQCGWVVLLSLLVSIHCAR
jgi:5-methyltetrahydropteroyltriglutamate--homocysteine methyltransferase